MYHTLNIKHTPCALGVNALWLTTVLLERSIKKDFREELLEGIIGCAPARYVHGGHAVPFKTHGSPALECLMKQGVTVREKHSDSLLTTPLYAFTQFGALLMRESENEDYGRAASF
jgi:hypothetical protein